MNFIARTMNSTDAWIIIGTIVFVAIALIVMIVYEEVRDRRER